MIDAAVSNLSLDASSTFRQYMVALELRLATRLTGLWFSIPTQNRLATKRHGWHATWKYRDASSGTSIVGAIKSYCNCTYLTLRRHGGHQKSWTALVTALTLPSEPALKWRTLEMFLKELDFGDLFW